MSNSHLIPESRVNKHGQSAIKYVRADGAGKSAASAIPAPILGFAAHKPARGPVLEGSLLSKHKDHEVLLGDFKKNADGSATVTPEDMRMVQRMLSEAVNEDQEAVYTSEDGGSSVYFVGYLMSQGDINALRTIYAKQGTKGNTVSSVWHALRYLRQFEVCDKETNYGTNPGFDGVYDLMADLGLNVSESSGSAYDYIDGMEGSTNEKKALLQYAFDTPDKAHLIAKAVIARETLDVGLIQQIMEADVPALSDGIL